MLVGGHVHEFGDLPLKKGFELLRMLRASIVNISLKIFKLYLRTFPSKTFMTESQGVTGLHFCDLDLGR